MRTIPSHQAPSTRTHQDGGRRGLEDLATDVERDDLLAAGARGHAWFVHDRRQSSRSAPPSVEPTRATPTRSTSRQLHSAMRSTCTTLALGASGRYRYEAMERESGAPSLHRRATSNQERATKQMSLRHRPLLTTLPSFLLKSHSLRLRHFAPFACLPCITHITSLSLSLSCDLALALALPRPRTRQITSRKDRQ